MRTDTAGTRAPLRLLFIGGRPALRTALAASPRTELVTDPAEADCALVDVASLTPAAHAEACRYPFAPSLPLVIMSAVGADRLADTNPYLAEVARAERAAAQARADHCVLRCAPMDVDLVQIARQIADFATVYGCFTDGPVPWLALDDLVDVAALLAFDPVRRGGRVYELTGHEIAPVTTVVDRLADAAGCRAESTTRSIPPSWSSRCAAASAGVWTWRCESRATSSGPAPGTPRARSSNRPCTVRPARWTSASRTPRPPSPGREPPTRSPPSRREPTHDRSGRHRRRHEPRHEGRSDR
ncbi:hypothetical protein ACIHFC_11525 [Streptomyces sp. NPDC052013]|uniref:hypothetical protein n=1 Tax=Streptomyces sp. NPDC052013 TaxID=3365679 RepID=UPI0037D3615C